MTIDRAIEIFDLFNPSHVSPSDDEIEASLQLATQALRFLKQMQDVPTCNTCAISASCEYSPAWGAQVRYNCPHHVPIKEESK